MKNIYIDSNIWLSLYYFKKDDLKQFKKLKALEGKDIKIYIPSQTRDEVLRNRDAKLKESIENFKKFNIPFPSFCEGYKEYDSFSKKYNKFNNELKKWLITIQNDINNQELPADKVISDMFNTCEVFECSQECIHDAELRYKSGNPPGKDNKYGDAINWECLLRIVPDGEDLYFISDDKDFKSVIDSNSFNLFLKEEWHKKKKSNVHFYRELSPFFADNFKNINLKTEVEKEELIDDLGKKHSTATVCALIRALYKYQNWSDRQIEDICRFVVYNPKIDKILEEQDIKEFFVKLIGSRTKNTFDSCDISVFIDSDK